MGSSSSLLLSVILGAVGVAYFVYGKRQMRFAPLFSGVALCVFPMFVTNTYAMLGLGALCLAAPFVIAL